MSNLYIVTVATDPEYYFSYLVDTCKKNGKEIVVLGYGEKWKGFTWRFKLMLEYIETLKDDDIVCFVDGYDVICTRDLNEMIESFNTIIYKHKCKIIVGYHYNINSFFKMCEYIFFGNIINSGTYIGKCKDILKMLESINRLDMNNKADDQVLLCKYYNLNKNEIYIDTKNEIFSTLHSYKRLELDKFYTIKNKQVLLKGTNIRPFFIHAPNSNYLDNIIIKLGYNYDYNNKIKNIIINSCPSTFNKLIKIYIPYIKQEIIKMIDKYKYKIFFIIISILFLLEHYSEQCKFKMFFL